MNAWKATQLIRAGRWSEAYRYWKTSHGSPDWAEVGEKVLISKLYAADNIFQAADVMDELETLGHHQKRSLANNVVRAVSKTIHNLIQKRQYFFSPASYLETKTAAVLLFRVCKYDFSPGTPAHHHLLIGAHKIAQRLHEQDFSMLFVNLRFDEAQETEKLQTIAVYVVHRLVGRGEYREFVRRMTRRWVEKGLFGASAGYCAALCEFRSGADPNTCISGVLTALQDNPRFFSGWELMGEMMQATGRINLAIGCLERALPDCKPEHRGKIHLKLAELFFRQGEMREAATELLYARELGLENPDLKEKLKDVSPYVVAFYREFGKEAIDELLKLEL
jgi:tetratricopeptide (TPR) repeat protein